MFALYTQLYTRRVRRGDSLSPMLFNIIMDKIIDQLPKHLENKMGDISIPVVCYADDAVLLAESQEESPTFLNTFQRVSERLNIEI